MPRTNRRSKRDHHSFLHPVFTLLLATLLLPACKAKPAKDAGFLEDTQRLQKNEETPFHRTWWDTEHHSLDQYTHIMVAPVNTNYIMAQNFWEKISLTQLSQDQLKKEIAGIASYTQQSFIDAAKNDPDKRFTVVDTPIPHTLILEAALVQLVPSKATLNALGYVSFFPPVITVAGSVASGSDDAGKGFIAIEARFRDASTGEIVGMFADREVPKTAIVDVKAVSWWGPAKAIIDEWANQLVALAKRKPGQKVKDSSTFELLVW